MSAVFLTPVCALAADGDITFSCPLARLLEIPLAKSACFYDSSKDKTICDVRVNPPSKIPFQGSVVFAGTNREYGDLGHKIGRGPRAMAVDESGAIRFRCSYHSVFHYRVGNEPFVVELDFEMVADGGGGKFVIQRPPREDSLQ